jgi:small-conductance mechanosensitive channel
MTQSGTGLWNLVHEPWYVIVGVVAATIVALWVESRLKARGWWPYKGDNMFIDNFIWGLGIFAVVVPVALLLNGLGV